jgi:hypothetical protein
LIWVPGEAEHHGGENIWQRLIISWWIGGRERERERKRERKGGTRYNLERHISSDLLPTARPHLLMFPPPPGTVPSALGTKYSTHESVGDISHLNHNIS